MIEEPDDLEVEVSESPRPGKIPERRPTASWLVDWEDYAKQCAQEKLRRQEVLASARDEYRRSEQIRQAARELHRLQEERIRLLEWERQQVSNRKEEVAQMRNRILSQAKESRNHER